MRNLLKISLLALLTIAVCSHGHSQDSKKVLGLEDYPKWKRIVSTDLSEDGNWISYSYRPNDGDDTLYIKHAVKGNIYSDPYCSDAVFSADSKWVAYKKNHPKKESEKLKKNKKDVFSKGVLLNLESGEKLEWEKIKDLRFSPTGDMLLLQKENVNKDIKGSDLLVKNLVDGSLMNIGNVSDFKFNTQGTLLAYTIDADSKAGNGVYLKLVVSV